MRGGGHFGEQPPRPRTVPVHRPAGGRAAATVATEHDPALGNRSAPARLPLACRAREAAMALSARPLRRAVSDAQRLLGVFFAADPEAAAAPPPTQLIDPMTFDPYC